MKRFFQLLFMPCEGIAGLTDGLHDRRLSRTERFAVRFHTLYCRACRRYRKQLVQLRRILHADAGTPVPDLRLREDARERIIRAVDSMRGPGPT
ncbi:MAG: hypothetical protein J5J06_20280 [Phycisphaerae bacterium]|nr:hypothetical protein [Phycisphaerae bacterium]